MAVGLKCIWVEKAWFCSEIHALAGPCRSLGLMVVARSLRRKRTDVSVLGCLPPASSWVPANGGDEGDGDRPRRAQLGRLNGCGPYSDPNASNARALEALRGLSTP